jgi:hypothetical protein
VRAIRLLRIFRILKLTQFLGEAIALRLAIRGNLRKITVFLFGVLTVVILIGALMYQIEGEANGFTSIPVAMYWAIVTVTTVGYGDISPHTVPGRVVASILMVLGYGIIAVPTGIVSFELARASTQVTSRPCSAYASLTGTAISLATAQQVLRNIIVVCNGTIEMRFTASIVAQPCPSNLSRRLPRRSSRSPLLVAQRLDGIESRRLDGRIHAKEEAHAHGNCHRQNNGPQGNRRG